MNILYIDIVDSFYNIRAAERIMFGKELKKHGYSVYFLLKSKYKGSHWIEDGNIIYNRRMIKFWKFDFDLLSVLFESYHVIKEHHIQIIVVRNDIRSGFAAKLLSIYFELRFIFIRAFPLQEFDLYKLELEDYKKNYYLKKIRIRINKKLVNFIMKKSDLVISRSKYYTQQLIKEGINNNKILSIPMGFDSTINLNNIQYKYLKKKHKLDTSFIMVYQGDMSTIRNIDFYLNVMSDLLKRDCKVILILIGGDNNEIDRLKRISLSNNIIDKVIFTGKISHEDVYKYLRLADISLSFIPPLPVYTISSPTKVVESLGVGTPVVANEEIFDQKEVIEKSRGGFCLSYSEKKVAETIIEIIKNKNILNKMSKLGRKYILNNRSYEILSRALNSILIKFNVL